MVSGFCHFTKLWLSYLVSNMCVSRVSVLQSSHWPKMQIEFYQSSLGKVDKTHFLWVSNLSWIRTMQLQARLVYMRQKFIFEEVSLIFFFIKI